MSEFARREDLIAQLRRYFGDGKFKEMPKEEKCVASPKEGELCPYCCVNKWEKDCKCGSDC